MVTISGPGCDEKRDAPKLGLSLAINKANECAMRREEATFYVRNVDGNVVGQAESFTDGSVNVYGSMPLVVDVEGRATNLSPGDGISHGGLVVSDR